MKNVCVRFLPEVPQLGAHHQMKKLQVSDPNLGQEMGQNWESGL
jgi:hypothetical protein